MFAAIPFRKKKKTPIFVSYNTVQKSLKRDLYNKIMYKRTVLILYLFKRRTCNNRTSRVIYLFVVIRMNIYVYIYKYVLKSVLK